MLGRLNLRKSNMENQTAETTASAEATASAAPASEQKQVRKSQRMSKWVMPGIPVLAVALLAYGYSTGYLQQAGSKASALAASFSPVATKTVKAEDKLSVAREAFAAGDMNAAIEAYRAIVASNPADMAARGELGNVYYAVGAMPEAAQTYFETASMAIEQDQLEVAEALMPAVSEGNPLLANQLSDKLFDAQNKLFDAQMRADMAEFHKAGQQQMQQQQQQFQQQQFQQPS
jgi:tetratricopeptide (TPR) repeat protein